MTELTKQDVQFVLSRLSRDMRGLLTRTPTTLAGGFIRSVISGERPSDIDLFGPSEEVLKVTALEYASKVGARAHFSDNAITLLAPPRLPVQFITRWVFEDPSKVVDSFDFTVCQAAIWYREKAWTSACSDRFYSDLAARRLHYTSPQRKEAAGGSMLRVRKFLKRGYNIQPNSLARVIGRLVMGIDFERPGMDDEAAIADVIAGLLFEVDPLLVIDGVEIGENEHEVKPPPAEEVAP